MTIRAFIKGLLDPELKNEAIRASITDDKSLRDTYSLVENARVTKIRLKKLEEEIEQEKKLGYYKEIVYKSMPKEEVEAQFESWYSQRDSTSRGGGFS